MVATTLPTDSAAAAAERGTARTRTAALLVAGAVVAGAASAVVAVIALAAGADPSFAPLRPLIYLPFVVLGFAAAAAGWGVVRAMATRPARLLGVLVPVLTVLSFAPDTVLAVTGFIPGTTITGVLALMLMHLVVVLVAVPVLRRALPLPRSAR